MKLVTGATGLVGGHLLWHLLRNTTEKVIALRRTSSKLDGLKSIFRFYTPHPEEVLQRIEWRWADVHEVESLETAFEGVRFVYHCAAVVTLSESNETLMKTNMEGTQNILDVCVRKNIQKLCFVSSIASCATDAPMVDESTPWNDATYKNAYALSKYHSEQAVFKAAEQGLKVVIVNPGVILGPTLSRSGSSLIFHKMRHGLLFYTSGGSGYVDVRDVVNIMQKLMESDVSGERFILVSENNSTREIITWIAHNFKKPAPLFKVGRRTLLCMGSILEFLGALFRFKPLMNRSMARTATKRTYYSAQKITNLLQYSFIPIEQTIRETCRFMLEEEKRSL